MSDPVDNTQLREPNEHKSAPTASESDLDQGILRVRDNLSRGSIVDNYVLGFSALKAAWEDFRSTRQ